MPNQSAPRDRATNPSLRVLIVEAGKDEAFSSSIRASGFEPVVFRASEPKIPRYDIAFVGSRATWSKDFVQKLKIANGAAPLVAIVDSFDGPSLESARHAGFDDVVSAESAASLAPTKISMWCSPMASPLVLDPTPIAELQKLQLEDGSALVPALVKLFFASIEDIDRIRGAFAAGDLEAVRTFAHDLKSSCANLGVVRMKCVCQKIELSRVADDMRVAIALLPIEFELAKLHLERAKLASFPKSA